MGSKKQTHRPNDVREFVIWQAFLQLSTDLLLGLDCSRGLMQASTVT